LKPTERKLSKAYAVNELRKAIYKWYKDGYPRVTNITRRLLEFWFEEDHKLGSGLFEFWFCQGEATKTLIYVYEVMKKRNF